MESVKGLDEKWVFPSPRTRKALSDVAVAKTLKRFHSIDKATVHGLRSTFRVSCEEQSNFSHAVKERALAHPVNNQTEEAYNRTDLYDNRRDLIDAWGRFAMSENGKNENNVAKLQTG